MEVSARDFTAVRDTVEVSAKGLTVVGGTVEVSARGLSAVGGTVEVSSRDQTAVEDTVEVSSRGLSSVGGTVEVSSRGLTAVGDSTAHALIQVAGRAHLRAQRVGTCGEGCGDESAAKDGGQEEFFHGESDDDEMRITWLGRGRVGDRF